MLRDGQIVNKGGTSHMSLKFMAKQTLRTSEVEYRTKIQTWKIMLGVVDGHKFSNIKYLGYKNVRKRAEKCHPRIFNSLSTKLNTRGFSPLNYSHPRNSSTQTRSLNRTHSHRSLAQHSKRIGLWS